MVKFYSFLIVTLLARFMSGQEVSISPELSLRNYFSYDILGDVDGKSIVVRDRGFNKEVDIFNRDLELVQSAELSFEKKRVDVLSVVELDSVFQMLYGYFEQDSMLLRYRIYDNSVRLLDSAEFFRVHKRDVRRKIISTNSDDSSHILLLTEDEQENLLVMIFNSVNRRLFWSSKIELAADFKKSLDEILLTDKGDFVMLFKENEWTSSKENLSMLIISPRKGLKKYTSIGIDDYIGSNILLDYDNLNEKLLLTGIYSEKKSKESKGYFYLSEKLDMIDNETQLKYISFQDKLYEELVQGRKRKSRVLEDIGLKDVIFRKDGGFLLISEIEREYSRRNPYSGYARTGYDNYSRRAWIDYYNDDIIISSISPEGKLDWNKVLYKKQFSQDDEGIYSSYFIMKSPSRLRFIYNDEIKKHNTVSEYLMDPAGKVARNSLLSTAYQNMKLRFRDAIQISSNSLIVPSERNYDLNLVRITY